MSQQVLVGGGFRSEIMKALEEAHFTGGVIIVWSGREGEVQFACLHLT